MSTVATAEVRMPNGASEFFAAGSSARLSLSQGAHPVRGGTAWAGANKQIP